jgi:hypothetical protein
MKWISQSTVLYAGYSAALFCTFILAACSGTKPAVTASPADIQAAVDNNAWVFTARDVIPSTGRSQVLTNTYDIRLSKDTLISYLPYFGRSFSGANAMTNQNPMDFKSYKLTIDKESAKKGSWKVMVKPNDYTPVRNMNFIFYDNGNATLTVNFNDNSPISYNGNIKPGK